MLVGICGFPSDYDFPPAGYAGSRWRGSAVAGTFRSAWGEELGPALAGGGGVRVSLRFGLIVGFLLGTYRARSPASSGSLVARVSARLMRARS